MKRWIIGGSIVTVAIAGIISSVLYRSHNQSNGVVSSHSQSDISSSVNLNSLSPIGTPTTSEKQQVFHKIWQLFNTYYPNFAMKGLDWSAEKSKYEPKAINASTWPQFFSIVNQMISDLNDPHCSLIGAPMPTTYTPSVLTAWSNGQVVVVWSNDSSKIPVGSIVIGVDGAPVSVRLERSEYSKGYLEGAGQEALMTTSSSPEQISLWIPSSDQTRKVTVPVYPLTGSPANNEVSELKNAASSAWPIRPGWNYGLPITQGDMAFRITHLQDGILYVYIPAMEPPQSSENEDALTNEFERILKLAQNSKGLILDIRGNDGGIMWPGLWFARHLYKSDMEPAEVRFPTSQYLKLPQTLTSQDEISIPLKPSTEKATPGFTKWGIMNISPLSPNLNIPVALLINGWNASAAENFTVFMKAAPNVSTFGSPTSGEDGSPRSFTVMKGVNVDISTWQERVMSTGFPIEGFGLAPDHPVFVSDSDLTKETIRSQQGDTQQTMKNDLVLQDALAWIIQKNR
ncbi:hypothetical protein AAC03nite_19610 [Alicyclobacillus acidoterrestris]|nr:hypothetical protein AAC03nite_19610 [Alicyclobacillus acidoterrestris]